MSIDGKKARAGLARLAKAAREYADARDRDVPRDQVERAWARAWNAESTDIHALWRRSADREAHIQDRMARVTKGIGKAMAEKHAAERRLEALWTEQNFIEAEEDELYALRIDAADDAAGPMPTDEEMHHLVQQGLLDICHDVTRKGLRTLVAHSEEAQG